MRLNLFVCAAIALGAAGCDDPPEAAPPPPIRAIKYMTLEAGGGAQMRRLSGVIVAGTTANAAFQAAGQVIELTKKVGDAVKDGEVLARLDPEPLRLRERSAESQLRQAQAAYTNANSRYSQQKQLFDRGYATRTAYEASLADVRTARGAVEVAQSELRIASRDLEKSSLRAPFSGVVARRHVEAFEEVSSGAPIYTIQSEGETEVEVSIPETLVNAVAIGEAVIVVVPLAAVPPLDGRVTEIAPLAEDVNAYPVKVRLAATPESVRPGMSAEVTFSFADAASDGSFTVPIAALKPAANQQGGTLFLFKDGKLEARSVLVVNVRENTLQVQGDLATGDIIATAGVSILYDGMPARLLDPAQLR